MNTEVTIQYKKNQWENYHKSQSIYNSNTIRAKRLKMQETKV